MTAQTQYQAQYQAQHAPRVKRRKPSFLKAFVVGVWQTLVTLLATTGLLGIVVGAWLLNMGAVNLPFSLSMDSIKKPFLASEPARLMSAAVEDLEQSLVKEPPRRVIYLNREGGVLTAGPDDSSRNMSSVVAGANLESHEIPAFRSSTQRWNAIVSCVQDKFEDFNVDVVDQRPMVDDYVMVMVGGSSGELATRTGHTSTRRTRITGLAPMARQPNHDAVVYVFAREMREQTKDVCETVAEEVGHAYGLDHVLDCHDPMTHLGSCGRRTFQDQDTVCGEHEARTCHTGAETQNSYQHLLEVLGPRPVEGEEDVNGRVAARGASNGSRS